MLSACFSQLRYAWRRSWTAIDHFLRSAQGAQLERPNVLRLLPLCPEWDVIGDEAQHVYCHLAGRVVGSYNPRLCPIPVRRATLRRHLYLSDLALHLCPFHLPGSLVIGVGLLQLAPPRLLLLKLLPELLQQRPQGLQHLPVLPKLSHTGFRQKTNKKKKRLKTLIRHKASSVSPSLILMSLVLMWTGVFLFVFKHSRIKLLFICIENSIWILHPVFNLAPEPFFVS